MRYWAVAIPVVLSIVYLLANHFAQPPTDLRPKIFVIGLSKTGTTSVGNALALLGYRRLGWKDIRSRHLVHTFINGDVGAVIDQTRYYDAFEDLPWPHMYRQMAEMYPDAKFVLSLRKDEQTWLRSMQRHMGRGSWEPAAYFYGAQWVDGNEDLVVNSYRNHTASVRDYFEDKPSRYAELVIDDSGNTNWQTLCALAQCPGDQVPSVGFPRSNAAETWHDGSDIISWLSFSWGWTITRIEELTSHAYYQRDWPIFNFVLEKIWDLISIIELACCDLYFKLVVKNEMLPEAI